MADLFQYAFMQRAMISGILIAVACSILGVFLVLRKNAFVGEGLAHISFGGIALGLLLGLSPLPFALIAAIIGAIGIVLLKEKTRLYNDTSIGIISYTGFALGVVLISLSKGVNADLFSYLFGSILTISKGEMLVSVVLDIIVVALVILFYNELRYITFDEDAAKISGLNVKLLNYVLGILVAVTVVISMKAVGLILVASFMILPAATALQGSRNFKQTILLAVLVGIVSVIAGILASYVYDLAAGATIVIVNFMLFILFFLAKELFKRKK